MYEFEFDPNKSLKNKEKHGINFIEGQELWQDIDLLEIRATTVDEERYVVIGKIGNKYWTGIITYRGDKIRIISIRSSRIEEEKLYESE
jgi:uncharacterized protein